MSAKMEEHDELVEELDEDFIDYGTDPDTTCTICQAEFLDPDDLAIHLQQIHKINSNAKQCMFCPFAYINLLEFAEHLRDNHLLCLKYCRDCLRAFDDYSHHRTHEKKHKTTNKSLFNCAHCFYKFSNVQELRKHDFESHVDTIDGVLMQPYLPYLSAALNVKADNVLMSVHTETVYICVGCEFSTANLTIFIDHARSKKCSVFVCDKCSNVYKNKKNIARHVLKDCVSIGTEKSKVCPDCNLSFDAHSFKKHKKNCKTIKCYTCGICYDTMYELSEHQSKEHPLAVELQSCKFCWKQCVGVVALQKHIDRSHKPNLHLYKYLCVYCKIPYKHPQKLFGHFFSKHKELEPYVCKICNLQFRVRKKFTLHIKLTHKSVGFVEFDKNYHVFFTEKKSEKPFVPKSIYADKIEELKNEAALEKPEDSSNIGLLNINSEMSVTETEGNQTEVESTPRVTLKRKRGPKLRKPDSEDGITVESSDDESLLVIKKRVQKTMPKIMRNRWTKKQMTNINKKRFTCNICRKYCYTYQNYNHHISLHSTKDYKKCIKCSKVFRSKEKLNRHMASDHSTSKLTETLKYLLEKRKTGGSITDDLPMSEKFRRTIKKVKSDVSRTTATITTVENGLSVQKFIENFTPEPEVKSEAVIDHAVTCKVVKGRPREPAIKMTKFKVTPTSSVMKLSMPVKFKASNHEKTPASIRLVQAVTTKYNEENQFNDFQNYDDDIDHNDSIPEVAEEVMLEETEETPSVAPIPHKIVIPKLPVEYKDIQIAHLLPEAPFFKIVKVNEVLNVQNLEKKKVTIDPNTIKLADGTKLVNTNPLAHLLGNKSIEKVMKPIINKYYKPRARNFQGMLAEALSNLDKPTPKKKKKNRELESVASEKTTATIN